MWKQPERCAEAGELLVLLRRHLDELMRRRVPSGGGRRGARSDQPVVADVGVPDLTVCRTEQVAGRLGVG